MKVKITVNLPKNEIEQLREFLPSSASFRFVNETIRESDELVSQFFYKYYIVTESFEDTVSNKEIYALFKDTLGKDINLTIQGLSHCLTKLHPFRKQYRIKGTGLRESGLCKLALKM